MQNTNGLCCLCQNSKHKCLLQGKGLQIRINNENYSTSADNTNLCLDNSSYPTRLHSIIVYYTTLERPQCITYAQNVRCSCW